MVSYLKASSKPYQYIPDAVAQDQICDNLKQRNIPEKPECTMDSLSG